MCLWNEVIVLSKTPKFIYIAQETDIFHKVKCAHTGSSTEAHAHARTRAH